MTMDVAKCVFVKAAKYVGKHIIWLEFDDGVAVEVDLGDLALKYEQARPLRDEANFAKFHLDSWPTLAWSCGFDVAPEELYSRRLSAK